MISGGTLASAPPPAPGANRRAGASWHTSGWVRTVLLFTYCLAALVLGLTLLGAAMVSGPDQRAMFAGAAQPRSAADGPAPAATPTPGAKEPAGALPPASVLQLSGDFPESGPGEFDVHPAAGRVLGTAGTLRRFRVAVERGAPEDVDAFAGTIDATLGDQRSWIGGQQMRFQRAASGSPYDFTIYLATAGTAERMCAAGGVDIQIRGEPFTSCRSTGRVVLNLNRWRLSVAQFVQAKVPLAVYRQYVVNHEVGHELGHGHEACPGAGRPAPVMQTQTLGLRQCAANPWPYLDGRRYAGPPI